MKRFIFCIASFVTIFMAFVGLKGSVLAAPDTELSIQTSVSTVTVGQTFTANILINTGTNQVVGTELYINFDSARLRAASIAAGSFFTSPETISPSIDNTNGTISYTIYLSPGATPETGSGVLAVITFEAISAGTANISISPDTIVGAINEGAENVLTTRTPASLTVQSSSTTDTSGSSSGTGGTTTSGGTGTTTTGTGGSTTTPLPESGSREVTLILFGVSLILLTSAAFFLRYRIKE